MASSWVIRTCATHRPTQLRGPPWTCTSSRMAEGQKSKEIRDLDLRLAESCCGSQNFGIQGLGFRVQNSSREG